MCFGVIVFGTSSSAALDGEGLAYKITDCQLRGFDLCYALGHPRPRLNISIATIIETSVLPFIEIFSIIVCLLNIQTSWAFNFEFAFSLGLVKTKEEEGVYYSAHLCTSSTNRGLFNHILCQLKREPSVWRKVRFRLALRKAESKLINLKNIIEPSLPTLILHFAPELNQLPCLICPSPILQRTLCSVRVNCAKKLTIVMKVLIIANLCKNPKYSSNNWLFMPEL